MSHLYTGSTLTFQEGSRKPQIVSSSHPKFKEIVALIMEPPFPDYDAAYNLVDLKSVVVSAIAGSNISLVGSSLYYKGDLVNSLLGQRILEIHRLGLPVDSLIAFLDNLMLNPSSRAVEELYGFLESSNLPITDDGHFLAYKAVNMDYTDKHSGKIDNSIGEVISMPRNKVSDNKDNTCSYGLHFAAHEYAEMFGGDNSRMMIMKINPRDVVSIPSDYNNQKGRCCEYEVLEEVKRDDRSLVGVQVIDTSPVAPQVTPEAIDADGWTMNAGKQPVADGTLITVEHNDGATHTEIVGTRYSTHWEQGSGGSHIRRWKLVAPLTPAPRVLQVGDKVQLSVAGKKEYCNSTANPFVGTGTVIEVDPTYGYDTRVKWDANNENSYRKGELTLLVPAPVTPLVPAEPAYVPQADNYDDSAVFDTDGEFWGVATLFPVNRKTSYELERADQDDNDGKDYGGNWFFTAYDVKHDNLVFRKHNGEDFDYVTVANVKIWDIYAENIVLGS